ncbi:alpha-L-fucosidase [Pararhodonellum marinum]|uniref:alpha-L-fucosidase n=1 Tax=Pararhodonellum marinum TaxID=2755358 RepID=UPI00188EE020|nr:alpha-L-fucosidase [Pararhodonellum marinum]
MKTKLCLTLIGFLLILASPCLQAQEDYTPSPENLENREWFQDAKYGLFIHWGVYSVMGGGGDMGIAEWIMNQKQIPIHAYENLPDFFNPAQFDAEEWVSIAKKAGMKYITITSKHHDGFAMYDSEVSDYNIVKATPYGKDVIRQLKEACDREGIKLFFYYSQLDWHHPDYFPRGRTGRDYTGRPESGDWNRYIEYMNAQLTELLTNYGDIGGIWFDGQWDKLDEDWQLDKTYSMIHALQPGALIGSNHHLMPFPGEDFQMFERDLPGQNTMGFNHTGAISELPLEMCETMNGSWGYNIKDRRFKTTKQLLQTLVRAAGANANFLLNTGPLPNGKLQPENVDSLMVMAEWLGQYGESIYGTRGGPVSPRNWGVTTAKDNKVFVHVMDAEDETILMPVLDKKIKKASLMKDGSKVTFKENDLGVMLSIPRKQREEIDTIVILEF